MLSHAIMAREKVGKHFFVGNDSPLFWALLCSFTVLILGVFLDEVRGRVRYGRPD